MNKFIAIILALFAVSCATQNMETTGTSLQNQWELITLNGNSVSINKPIVLNLTNPGQISGTTGCNQIMGNYSVKNNSEIKFSALALTRMMCEENLMHLENDLLKVLENVDGFHVDGEVLSLQQGNKQSATFHKISNSQVVGRYWKLIQLDGEAIKMDENQEREQFFILKSDGTMYGFAGCNTFNGTYTLEDGQRVRFSDHITTTLQACPDVKVKEHEMLKVFSLSDNYAVTDNKLYLHVGKRAPLAVFESVEF